MSDVALPIGALVECDLGERWQGQIVANGGHRAVVENRAGERFEVCVCHLKAVQGSAPSSQPPGTVGSDRPIERPHG